LKKLTVVVLFALTAAGHTGPAAGRNRAKENSKQSEENARSHQGRTYEF